MQKLNSLHSAEFYAHQTPREATSVGSWNFNCLFINLAATKHKHCGCGQLVRSIIYCSTAAPTEIIYRVSAPSFNLIYGSGREHKGVYLLMHISGKSTHTHTTCAGANASERRRVCSPCAEWSSATKSLTVFITWCIVTRWFAKPSGDILRWWTTLDSDKANLRQMQRHHWFPLSPHSLASIGESKIYIF
jgi:hypothetical protein